MCNAIFLVLRFQVLKNHVLSHPGRSHTHRHTKHICQHFLCFQSTRTECRVSSSSSRSDERRRSRSRGKTAYIEDTRNSSSCPKLDSYTDTSTVLLLFSQFHYEKKVVCMFCCFRLNRKYWRCELHANVKRR